MLNVPEWISDEVWKSSVYGYGIPAGIRHLIDRDIGKDWTYTDAMLSLVPRLRKPVSYLELGVSVGKNFLQVANSVRGATLVGFDIEELSPVLKERFHFLSRVEWDTRPESLKNTRSSLTSLQQCDSSNRIDYLCGDVFDRGSWAKLAGRTFNLIFSDAFHSPTALHTECRSLIELDLLDRDEVVIVWDDLEGDMQGAFRDISRKLKQCRRNCHSEGFIAPWRGWLGENWQHHSVGFFISIRY